MFVPAEALDAVRDAVFAAGAGRIGAYERCSWYAEGTGTFLGGEGTDPGGGRAREGGARARAAAGDGVPRGAARRGDRGAARARIRTRSRRSTSTRCSEALRRIRSGGDRSASRGGDHVPPEHPLRRERLRDLARALRRVPRVGRARRARGPRARTSTSDEANPNNVTVTLDFDDAETAQAYVMNPENKRMLEAQGVKIDGHAHVLSRGRAPEGAALHRRRRPRQPRARRRTATCSRPRTARCSTREARRSAIATNNVAEY